MNVFAIEKAERAIKLYVQLSKTSSKDQKWKLWNLAGKVEEECYREDWYSELQKEADLISTNMLERLWYRRLKVLEYATIEQRERFIDTPVNIQLNVDIHLVRFFIG